MLRESLPVGPCPQISPPGFICRVSVHLLLSGAGEGDQEVGVRERRAPRAWVNPLGGPGSICLRASSRAARTCQSCSACWRWVTLPSTLSASEKRIRTSARWRGPRRRLDRRVWRDASWGSLAFGSSRFRQRLAHRDTRREATILPPGRGSRRTRSCQRTLERSADRGWVVAGEACCRLDGDRARHPKRNGHVVQHKRFMNCVRTY